MGEIRLLLSLSLSLSLMTLIYYSMYTDLDFVAIGHFNSLS